MHLGTCVAGSTEIDRDGERFSEQVLDRFAATLPGKKLMVDHSHTAGRWGA